MQFTHPLTRIAGNCTFCARPRRPRKWVQLRRRPAERAINTWATGAWCHHHCVVLNYVDSGALEAALRSCLKWATFRPTRPSPFLTRKHGHKSTWPRWVLVGWKKNTAFLNIWMNSSAFSRRGTVWKALDVERCHAVVSASKKQSTSWPSQWYSEILSKADPWISEPRSSIRKFPTQPKTNYWKSCTKCKPDSNSITRNRSTPSWKVGHWSSLF